MARSSPSLNRPENNSLRNANCFNIFPSSGYPVKIRAVDVRGRLGSLYDSTANILISEYASERYQTKSIESYTCEIFRGNNSTDPIRCLDFIEFNRELQQTIRQQRVPISGVARIIEYDQPITTNTRFFYYRCIATKDKLVLKARKAHKIVPPPRGHTDADYMITKIEWGFEILCVIQPPRQVSIEAVEQSLLRIQSQLKHNQIPVRLDDNDRRILNQLDNITVFGTETCVDDPYAPLLTILGRIRALQQSENLHQPLIYTMQPLRWLYGRQVDPTPVTPPPESVKQIAQAQKYTQRINNQIEVISQMFYRFPGRFPGDVLNQRLKDLQQHYQVLLDRQEDLEQRIQNATVGIRRRQVPPAELNALINNTRYQCLREKDIEDFRIEVERLLNKAKLIDRLDKDRIEYINAFDVGSERGNAMTNEAIDAILRRNYSRENGTVILWHTADRLKRDQSKKWNEIREHLLVTRQRATQRTQLVYVDFTQCKQRLENQVIVRLPEHDRFERKPDRPIKRKPSKSEPSSPVRNNRPRIPDRQPIRLRPTTPSEEDFPQPPPPPITSTRKPQNPPNLIPIKLVDSQPPPPLKTTVRPQPPSPAPIKTTVRPQPPPIPPLKTTVRPQPPPPSPIKTTVRPQPPSIPPLKTIVRPQPQTSIPVPSRNEINVLLLGETGVGKSTFINSFVNYLKFETLEQAERGEPVVLIPVSFLVTTGENFDEFTVNFGNPDDNEDFENEGQSVTQHCKSYIFDLNAQTSLRIIDTPGIGDTRGIAQDMKNIEHILTYINALPKLDAVCLLLKPNASRLNIFFRSCVNQLITYLTPIGYENIIFCFTNARSTFYAPGDTGRLLREMLKQEHLTDIPFKKENTFCFDSESFRYLAARKCGIDFDEFQRKEYKNSWNVSVGQSTQFLKYIRSRQPYKLQSYQSPRKAILDINTLARPLMETLRLIIYNWKISEAKIVFNQMNINATPAQIEMCTYCAQTNIVPVGPYWLIQYQEPILQNNKANQHAFCPTDRNHIQLEIILRHEFPVGGAGLKNQRWQNSLQDFLLDCDRLNHFLRQQGPSTTDDPFQAIIERFLDEEQQLSQYPDIDYNMNRRVRDVLQSLRQIRQENSQQLFDRNERLSLRDIYGIIDRLLRIDTVQKQVEAIKQSRQIVMKNYERRISANLIQNRKFND